MMEIPAGSDPSLNQLVRSRTVEWEPLREPGITGIFLKVLRWDNATRRAPTILLRFSPGASYPGHTHPAGEEIFVLEGDIRFGPDLLSVGDYLCTAPGNFHTVYSENGCVILVSIPQAVEIIQRRSS